MYKGKSILAIIPARGGSKGVLRKNIRLIGGKPLVAYPIKNSVNSKYVDRTIVSTEDLEIARICRRLGAEVIMRPKELAGDEVDNEPVMLHVLDVLKHNFLLTETMEPDYVVLLEPAGVFRRKEDIDNAIKKLIDEEADSLLSVYMNDVFFWSKEGRALNYDYTKRPRRQDKQWEFVENSNIYITKTELLLRTKCRLGGKIILYEMPKELCCEIDTEFDLEMANWMVKTRRIKA